MTRINRVLEHMAKLQVDSVIIKDVTTIRYLTGFTGDSSLLYLDRQQGVLITDGRYTEQARNEMKFFKVLEYTPTGAHSIWAAAADLAKNAQAQVVGFDGAYYSYDDYTVLHELLGETYMQSIDFSDIRMIKDKKELDMLLKAASIADEAFIHLLEDIKPGCTERSLAGRLEYYMRALGSEKASFDTIVASGVRSALPHGMASDKVIEVGDFITFDFGAVYKGYHSDAARTHGVGEISKEAALLIERTRESFFQGMQYARAGRRLYEISGAIGDYAESYGYGVVYDLVGHGIGTHLHEEPEIPNFRQWRRGLKLKAGMTLAVEPMINAGSPDVEWMDDEWTVVTYDGSLSAHYENTILITEGRPEILTLTEEERECIWQE